MLGTLFDHLTPPPVPPRVRLRHRRHACGEYVRKVKGEKYQLRWWLEADHGGSINCGLYDSEWQAERVREQLKTACRSVAGRGTTVLSLWEAMKPLIARGVIPAGVLPKYVYRTPEGYGARVKKGGRVLDCPGPFDSPEAAHTALADLLRQNFSAPAPAARPNRRLATLVDFLPGERASA